MVPHIKRSDLGCIFGDRNQGTVRLQSIVPDPSVACRLRLKPRVRGHE
jgi:hypothetical protein